jgi:carbonic anhydrase
MSAIDEVLTRHEQSPVPADALAAGAPPALHLTIVTCMDARIDAYRTFGLKPGEAHLLRNAGGVVTDDVLRSLAISQRKLGTQEVIVMQHTSCGMTGISDDGFRAELEADTGLRPTWAVEAFTDVEASVRQNVERVRRNPFVPHTDDVRGFVYDVTTGGITEVK